ncbi:MAG: sigma-70 family RNA polymerase sigma factor [Deltaproteobacteria bacterium]|nr:sigma-70 family RNA polymerase sigma factor [Deltaproteobacteria bacterium]
MALRVVQIHAHAVAHEQLDEMVELVDGVRAGRPEAQLALWRLYAPMVTRMAQRTLRPGADVDDLVQDVFVAAFRDVKSLRDPTKLKSFVAAIAVNLIRRELARRRIRRWFESESTGGEAALAREPSSSAAFALGRLYSLLDRLRPNDRLVFVLRQVEGHSVEEAAELMGISRASVKRHYAHVLARLSRHIQNDPFLVDYLPQVTTGTEANTYDE